MIDPHPPVIGALTGAAISTTSLILGAHVDALAIGLVAAVFVTIWTEKIDSKSKAASAVLFAALLAAYGSPVAAGWVGANIPSMAGNAESLRLLLALLIGGAAPSLIPVGIRYLSRKGDAL